MDDGQQLRKDRTDEQLACHAQTGCRASFEALVRRYQVRLLRYLECRSGSRQTAEDVLQEAFLAAFMALKSYDPKWRFSTWIFTIAKRIDIRTQTRNSRMQSVSADCETVDFRRPEDPLTGQESKRYLWQSVKERTSDDEFHALWLTYVEDMSTDQVAVVLGRTRAAIKMLLSRVRRRLSRVLNADAVQQHALPTSTSQKSFPSRERLAG